MTSLMPLNAASVVSLVFALRFLFVILSPVGLCLYWDPRKATTTVTSSVSLAILCERAAAIRVVTKARVLYLVCMYFRSFPCLEWSWLEVPRVSQVETKGGRKMLKDLRKTKANPASRNTDHGPNEFTISKLFPRKGMWFGV